MKALTVAFYFPDFSRYFLGDRGFVIEALINKKKFLIVVRPQGRARLRESPKGLDIKSLSSVG